jgi:hypothetical protein
MSNFSKTGAYPWALVGIFAAVQLVMTIFPMTFAIGTGGALTLGLIAAPIIGYLLGPIYGIISVFIGSFLGVAIDVAVHPLLWLTPIAPTISAFIAGALRVRKALIVPLVYIIAIALFMISPIGLLSYYFLWFHIIAFLMSFLFLIPKIRTLMLDGLDGTKGTKPYVGFFAIWIFSLIAVLGDQLVGSAVGSFLFVALGTDAATVAGWYTFIIFIYPVERLLASIAAAFVIFALSMTLAKSLLPLPTQPWGEGVLELSEEEIDDSQI